MASDTEVAVVGAGLSGLVAARELRRRGIDVIVLEAAHRCGGRALSETSVLGSRLDLGGQWIGRDHRRLIALADEFGATRYTMHTGALPEVIDGDRRLRLSSPVVLVAAASLVSLELARRVGHSKRWESVTVGDWLRRVPGRARRLLEVTALVSWTTDLDRMTVRTMMELIRSQGGLRHMLSTKGGAQDALIAEGVGFVVDRLHDEVGAAVRLGAEVTAIERDERGATVRSTAGDFRVERVIVTIPPPMAARIAHIPELPQARRALQVGTAMGSVYKAIAVYPTPFWRASAGGELLLLDVPGAAVFDTSPPDGPGHLCFLVGGPEAHSLDGLTPAERTTALLPRVANKWGPEALSPVGWHEKAWHRDPHAGGGYIALPDLAGDATVPMSAEPVGRVHWAGAETATDHPGYLDGAIEAGERAAREVAAALRAATPA